ncbi:helix-turn-helix domain-containing protein [Halobacteriaceae archaeon GCM10025711]
MPEIVDESADPQSNELQLRAELELGIPPETSCPVFNQVDGEVNAVSLFPHAGTCHVDVEWEDAEEASPTRKRRFSQDVGNCSCPAFWAHGCTPNILQIRGDTAISEVYVPDRETLKQLVADIKETGRSVKLLKLTPVDEGSERSELRSFQTARLTEKERAAVERAVARGYYESPSRVSLQELADEFGITKQSLSDRLQSAESKMVTDMFGDTD